MYDKINVKLKIKYIQLRSILTFWLINILNLLNMKLILLAVCLIAATQACVTRNDAIAKGMEWVNAHVPYSQTGQH